jgi:CheY-like chemotaxis protein
MSKRSLPRLLQRVRKSFCIKVDLVLEGARIRDILSAEKRPVATRPEIKVLYITGQIESDLGRQCVADKLGSVLSKPFGPREFLARINELLNQSREADAS